MSEPTTPPGPLPLRWAVIFIGALVVCLFVGGLAFVQTRSWPAALRAALSAAGATVVALHVLL